MPMPFFLPINHIFAYTTILAWIGGAFVNLDVAVFSGVTAQAITPVTINSIDADGPIEARSRCAFINI